MKSIAKIMLAAALTASPALALAQNTYSGYFLDGYTYGYELNPAFGNDKGYVSMPALGNWNTALRGSLELQDVLYNVNGRTVLFTNPQVDAKTALSKFDAKNKLGVANKIQLLSAGFKAFGGYNTISISAVANVDVTIPGSFFRLAKEGVSNRTYDIKDMSARGESYAQIALNHSHDISQVPGLRVGATLKFLIGTGAVEAKFRDAQLQLAENGWIARTNADIYASVGGLRFDMDTYEPKAGGAPYEYVSGANLDDGYKLNGFGMGIDLGAEYKWRDFRFSLAVLDLGFMRWGKTQWASTDGTREVQTDSYVFNADDDASNSFDREWDRFSDNLMKLYQLKDMGEISSRSRALAATLNVGVEYELPCYRKLSFGFLNSTRFNSPYTWTQFRLSANVAPVKVFSASVNGAVGSYGFDFGWLLNFHATGFNFFLGMDHTFLKVAKQGVPLSSNGSFNLGMNFLF